MTLKKAETYLLPVCQRFTEGFEITDLVAAKQLLDEPASEQVSHPRSSPAHTTAEKSSFAVWLPTSRNSNWRRRQRVDVRFPPNSGHPASIRVGPLRLEKSSRMVRLVVGRDSN